LEVEILLKDDGVAFFLIRRYQVVFNQSQGQGWGEGGGGVTGQSGIGVNRIEKITSPEITQNSTIGTGTAGVASPVLYQDN